MMEKFVLIFPLLSMTMDIYKGVTAECENLLSLTISEIKQLINNYDQLQQTIKLMVRFKKNMLIPFGLNVYKTFQPILIRGWYYHC